jgi:threonine dehydrogenase-like Zn-dependent dehydrogenase
MTVTPTVRAAVVGRRDRHQRARLEVREIPTPRPHAPGWVTVRPALSGICGADLDLVRGRRPSGTGDGMGVIPGHEIVGVVSEARSTRWVREGQRVLVEPTLRCAHKGLRQCPRCRAGEGHLCENADRDGPVCTGSGVGFSAATGGGWSDALLVHEDMLLPAEGISDQRAVLAEPAATALHAVMRWQRRGDRVAVIGNGPVSRLVVAVLARLHRDLDISVVYDGRTRERRRFGRRHRSMPRHFTVNPEADSAAIRSMGAARVWRGSSETILDNVATLTVARRLRHGDGLPVLDRGLDAVFDCRGTAASVQLGMHMLRAGGTLVLLQRPAHLEADWSLLWSREITLAGAARYGREANGWRTFAVVRDWLGDPGFPVDGMVTHRFHLDEIDNAVAAAEAGAGLGAVKVVIEGTAGPGLRERLREEQGSALDSDEPVLLHVAAKRVQSTTGETVGLPR